MANSDAETVSQEQGVYNFLLYALISPVYFLWNVEGLFYRHRKSGDKLYGISYAALK